MSRLVEGGGWMARRVWCVAFNGQNGYVDIASINVTNVEVKDAMRDLLRRWLRLWGSWAQQKK